MKILQADVSVGKDLLPGGFYVQQEEEKICITK